MIMASGTCISTSAVWIVRKKYFQFISIDKKKALIHIKPLLILFVSIVAGSINRMLDKTMLGWFNYYSELGCYEYADKFVRMPVTVITAVGTVMLSKTSTMIKSSLKNEKSKLFGMTLRYVSVFASLFVFGFLTFGKDFSVFIWREDNIELIVLFRLLWCTGEH
jgi:O-antigen/teichoic acid export membrane protein